MSDYFRVKKITDLNEVDENTIFPTSDFASLTQNNKFVQLEYVEGEEGKLEPYQVKPGIWAIQKTGQGLKLYTTQFVTDKILDNLINVKNVTEKIDCFFNRIPVYYEMGFEVAKRAALLFGPAGTGKSSIITQIVQKYTDGETAIVIWHTDKFEAYQVKDFIKSFEYVGVKKLILIAEDIGGIEVDQAKMKSDSSLLSLLDNQEKTFTIPTFILATTNYPANFMGNLTNRPNRFDDKIEVGYPSASQRKALLDFFGKDLSTDDAKDLLASNSCKEFTPAHIREIVIRSKIYDKTILEVIKEMCEEITTYNRMFQKGGRMGFDD